MLKGLTCKLIQMKTSTLEASESDQTDLRSRAFEKLNEHINLSTDELKDIEIGIFNWCIDYCTRYGIFPGLQNDVFVKLYNNKLVSILCNLDESSYINHGGKLLQKVKDGGCKPHDIAFMEPYEMNPDKWMPILNAKLKKERSMLNANVEAKTDLFKCGKCKQRKCSYYEMQIRSADESATIFVTCLNPSCKNKWRIG